MVGNDCDPVAGLLHGQGKDLAARGDGRTTAVAMLLGVDAVKLALLLLLLTNGESSIDRGARALSAFRVQEALRHLQRAINDGPYAYEDYVRLHEQLCDARGLVECPVGAAQVFDSDPICGGLKLRMLPRDGGIAEHDVTLAASSYHHGARANAQLLARVLARSNPAGPLAARACTASVGQPRLDMGLAIRLGHRPCRVAPRRLRGQFGLPLGLSYRCRSRL